MEKEHGRIILEHYAINLLMYFNNAELKDLNALRLDKDLGATDLFKEVIRQIQTHSLIPRFETYEYCNDLYVNCGNLDYDGLVINHSNDRQIKITMLCQDWELNLVFYIYKYCQHNLYKCLEYQIVPVIQEIE